MQNQQKLSSMERGQGLVEYALILVMVAVVVIVGLSIVGTSVSGVYCDVVTTLDKSAVCDGGPKNNNQNGDLCQKLYDDMWYVYQRNDIDITGPDWISTGKHYSEDQGYQACPW